MPVDGTLIVRQLRVRRMRPLRINLYPRLGNLLLQLMLKRPQLLHVLARSLLISLEVLRHPIRLLVDDVHRHGSTPLGLGFLEDA